MSKTVFLSIVTGLLSLAFLTSCDGKQHVTISEMADDVTPHIGGAPLRAMQERYGALYSAKRQGRSKRLTKFAGICGGNVSFSMRFHNSVLPFDPPAVERWTCPHFVAQTATLDS